MTDELREVIDLKGMAELCDVAKDTIKRWRLRYDDFPSHINDNERYRLYSRAQFTNWYAGKWPEKVGRWPVRLHRIFVDQSAVSQTSVDLGPIEESRGYLRAVKDLRYGDWRVWSTDEGFAAEKGTQVHIWALDTSKDTPEEWFVYLSRYKTAGRLEKGK
jgi:hypothetical protein